MTASGKLPAYRESLAGSLLAAREAVMAPIRPILRRAGVTEQQWRVLRILVDEGTQDASALAEKAMLLAPSITRILRELLDRGLLSRVPDPRDGRRSMVTASETGRALISSTGQDIVEVIAMFGAVLGEQRLSALIDELHESAAAIDRGVSAALSARSEDPSLIDADAALPVSDEVHV